MKVLCFENSLFLYISVGQTTRREKILVRRQKIPLFKKTNFSIQLTFDPEIWGYNAKNWKKKILRRRRKKFARHCWTWILNSFSEVIEHIKKIVSSEFRLFWPSRKSHRATERFSFFFFFFLVYFSKNIFCIFWYSHTFVYVEKILNLPIVLIKTGLWKINSVL